MQFKKKFSQKCIPIHETINYLKIFVQNKLNGNIAIDQEYGKASFRRQNV